MADFKVGDVVRLKSGGPKMSVERLGRDSRQETIVFTQWFKDEDVKTGHFPPDSLEKAG